jgi:hypothetical protein
MQGTIFIGIALRVNSWSPVCLDNMSLWCLIVCLRILWGLCSFIYGSNVGWVELPHPLLCCWAHGVRDCWMLCNKKIQYFCVSNGHCPVLQLFAPSPKLPIYFLHTVPCKVPSVWAHDITITAILLLMIESTVLFMKQCHIAKPRHTLWPVP